MTAEGSAEHRTPREGRASSATGVAVGGLIVFALFRLPFLTWYAPWADEAMTLTYSAAPLRDYLSILAGEQTQPPLMYVVFWLWRVAGPDALWWQRLLPCLFGILTALPVLAICRRSGLGRDATPLAVGFTAASQFLVLYSNELRAYSLYALLAAVSLALWLRTRETGARRDWTWLTAVNVLLVHTHFFGGLVVAAEWVDAMLVARTRRRSATLSAAATAASLIPWIGVVVRRAMITGDALSGAAGILRPDIGGLLDPWLAALGRSPWLAVDLLLFLALALAITVHVVRDAQRATLYTPLIFVAVVPTAIGFLVSVVAPRSVWIDRYLIATAVPFLILGATAITAALPVGWRRASVVFALVPAATTAFGLATGWDKVAFDALARRMAAGPAHRTVYVVDWNEGAPLAWQAAHGVGNFSVRYVPVVDSIIEPSGWLVWSEHHPPAGPPPAALMIRRGYVVGPPISATGMYDDALARPDSVVAVPFRRAAP